MNPVFWLLVILGAVLIWVLGSCVFYPLGVYFWRLWNDMLENVNRDDRKIKEEKENKE